MQTRCMKAVSNRLCQIKNCCVAEHDRFGGGSVMVRGDISYDGSTDLYGIRNGSLTCIRYRDEILAPIVRLYAGAIGDDFIKSKQNLDSSVKSTGRIQRTSQLE
jgi:hypothetical protein